MQPITTPINMDDKDAITNLQSALLFLLDKKQLKLTDDELQAFLKQLNEEMQAGKYGDGTKKLITILQQQFGIADDKGVVQEATSNKLNELLKGLGAFEEPANSILVKRTITYTDGEPYSELIIRAFDKDSRREVLKLFKRALKKRRRDKK